MRKLESLSAKLEELGIPRHEITPSVSIAVEGLLEQTRQLSKSVNELREQLDDVQGMIDVDTSGTNYPNRKALIKRLNWTIAMNKRYSGTTCIVSFSINDFESVNRTYGYEGAARVAAYVANFIAGNIRDTDYFARLNENQFGAIMYFAAVEDVKIKADKLCSELRNAPLRWNNSYINTNLAFGVHEITPADDAETALLASLNALFVNDTKIKFEQINFKA